MRAVGALLAATVPFVAAVLLAGCDPAAPAAAAPAGDAEPQTAFEWTLLSTVPRGLPGPGTGALRFAERIETMSAGRLRITVRGAGEVVGAFDVFDAVQGGDAEMGHGAAFFWRGKIPEAVFFAAVPFGMNAQETNGWLYHGEGLELWRELYEPFGVVPFPAGNSGAQMGGWFNREIADLDDVRGLRMRILGLGAAVLERAGGTPVSLPPDAVFGAMQTGVIDAVEWVAPYNDLPLGLHQVAHYYYYPGWQEPGPPLELIVGADAWASLPPDLQAIVAAAARSMNEEMLAEYTARNHASLRTLVDEHDVELRAFPAPVLAELRRLSDEVLAEIASTSPMAGRIHASYMAYFEDVRAWHDISEKAYLDARARTAPE